MTRKTKLGSDPLAWIRDTRVEEPTPESKSVVEPAPPTPEPPPPSPGTEAPASAVPDGFVELRIVLRQRTVARASEIAGDGPVDTLLAGFVEEHFGSELYEPTPIGAPPAIEPPRRLEPTPPSPSWVDLSEAARSFGFRFPVHASVRTMARLPAADPAPLLDELRERARTSRSARLELTLVPKGGAALHLVAVIGPGKDEEPEIRIDLA